jgi:hypothetical protein
LKLYTGSCKKELKKVVKKAPKKCKVVQNCIFKIDLGVHGAVFWSYECEESTVGITIYSFVMYEVA